MIALGFLELVNLEKYIRTFKRKNLKKNRINKTGSLHVYTKRIITIKRVNCKILQHYQFRFQYDEAHKKIVILMCIVVLEWYIKL